MNIQTDVAAPPAPAFTTSDTPDYDALNQGQKDAATVGILKEKKDKQKKDTAGVYQNTGEFRDENVIDKFFHAESGRTVTELKSGIEQPVFLEKWRESKTGSYRDRSTGLSGTAGVPGQAPGASAAAAKPKSSLFGA